MPDGRLLATDGVVVVDGQLLLLERDHPPEEGQWVLPGGLVERDETAQDACVREVREEVGLHVEPVGRIGIYDSTERDDRGNASVAYRCRVVGDATPVARDEARTVSLFDLENLPSMGFDHETIVADALATSRRSSGSRRPGRRR